MLASLVLAGCSPEGQLRAPTCDPRALGDGEVRARPALCSAELVAGGEGRTGDWILENAVARFVIRGEYASLTALGEPGGSLVDATWRDEDGVWTPDPLTEWRPDAVRVPVEVDGDTIRAGDVRYSLAPDDPVLRVDGAAGGWLLGTADARRVGATIEVDGALFALDGAPDPVGTPTVYVDAVTRVAPRLDLAWPDGAAVGGEGVDADAVVASLDGVDVARFAVSEGAWQGWAPAGAALRAERDGCTYADVQRVACASLDARVYAAAGAAVPAVVTDGTTFTRLRPTDGPAPLGPAARRLHVWAGPAWSTSELDFPGVDARASRLVVPAMDIAEWEQVAFASGWPDASEAGDDVGRLYGEGVGTVIVVASDEVPRPTKDERDDALLASAVRTNGWIWSWPHTPVARKGAHGAPDVAALATLDQLAVARGGVSGARRTVVSPDWVDAAFLEADPAEWAPVPDAVRLDGPEDVATLLRLADAWVHVAPVSDRFWVRRRGDRGLAAVEQGLVRGETVAGTGPIVHLTVTPGAEGALVADVRVDAPAWAEVDMIELRWGERTITGPLDADGRARFLVPEGAPYLVALARGAHARPWGDGEAWAVVGPLWLR